MPSRCILRCTAVCWLALAGGVALAAPADPTSPTVPPTDQQAIRARIVAEERDDEWRVMGFSRLRASVPRRLSAGVGAIFSRQPRSYDCHAVCDFKGWFIGAEPGYSGGQLSVGFADVKGHTGAREHFIRRVYLAYGVRVALLKTWNGADLTPTNQTLAGIEGDFTVIGINFSLGAFRHVGSGDPRQRWIVSGGLGWGF